MKFSNVIFHIKDSLALEILGIYNVHSEHNLTYTGQTGHFTETWVLRHHQRIRLYKLEKSVMTK